MLKQFTVKIVNVDGSLAIEGCNEPGETWEATMMRLHRRTTQVDDIRVLTRPQYGPFQELPATGSGMGIAVVDRCGRDSVGTPHQQEYVNYETEPPQF
jgi:hypothetical protein